MLKEWEKKLLRLALLSISQSIDLGEDITLIKQKALALYDGLEGVEASIKERQKEAKA